MSSIKLYKTYSFKNKDPIIDKLRTVIKDKKAKYSSISNDSGVSEGTIRNWFHGSTLRPQFATLNAVARALDCELALIKRRS